MSISNPDSIVVVKAPIA